MIPSFTNSCIIASTIVESFIDNINSSDLPPENIIEYVNQLFAVSREQSIPPDQVSSYIKQKLEQKQKIDEEIKQANDMLHFVIIPICKKIGVTRIAYMTYMDRIYVPNYSAVLPGTEDKIWVYSGKGPTRAHAKASVLMEAIERFSSLSSVTVAASSSVNTTDISSDSSFATTATTSATNMDATDDTIGNTMKTKRKRFVRGSYWQLSN